MDSRVFLGSEKKGGVIEATFGKVAFFQNNYSSLFLFNVLSIPREQSRRVPL